MTPPLPLRLPIGISDFRQLREPGVLYVKSAMAKALRQIRERDDAAELRAAGAAPIHEIGVVFDGKQAHVQAAPA